MSRVAFMGKQLWTCQDCGWINYSKGDVCTACEILKEISNEHRGN